MLDGLLSEPRRTFVALQFLHRSPDIATAQGSAERAHGTIQMCHLPVLLAIDGKHMATWPSECGRLRERQRRGFRRLTIDLRGSQGPATRAPGH
jgi:hypothetical protein